VVTHQLQIERRTAKGHRPKTDALPLDHTTNTKGEARLHCQADVTGKGLNMLFALDCSFGNTF